MSLGPSGVSWIRLASRIAVSVLPVLSSPVHLFSLQCLVFIFPFAPAIVFCRCFVLFCSLFFLLLLHRVCQVFWLIRGGISLSLFCLVCLGCNQINVRKNKQKLIYIFSSSSTGGWSLPWQCQRERRSGGSQTRN